MFSFWRVLVPLVCLTMAAEGVAQEKLTLNIPAQPVHEAIRALAQQSGLQIAARSDDLSGVQSNAVQGSYAPLEALRLLLNGTGLDIAVSKGNLVTIRRQAAAKPAARAALPK